MTDTPWLTIIGLHEDGLEALSSDAVICLNEADVIMAPPRHLSHLDNVAPTVALKPDINIVEWPVPYDTGISQLLAMRGRQVVVLASGDPFHYGAGTSITRHLGADEWQCFPAPS
ncbi:MAG: SAM-dependent methyltransferase, partial [Candidatus Puniceispirillaceae bacterium]